MADKWGLDLKEREVYDVEQNEIIRKERKK
jgi:hypothetical protein